MPVTMPAANAPVKLSLTTAYYPDPDGNNKIMHAVPWYGVKEAMMNELMTIGELAKVAGVNVETIRYYQRRGLLKEPPKPLGGHRRYAPDAAERVRFIKRAQRLGFTLDEVTGLLLLDDGQSCRETRLLAERKLAMIDERIADLNRMRKLLKSLIAECAAGQRPRSCPIIASLSVRP